MEGSPAGIFSIMKIKRNAPCPCGSRKKFKAGCARRPSAASQSRLADGPLRFVPLQPALADVDSYGHVKPILTAKTEDQRIVVVGREIYASERWETLTDFLFDYVKEVFGHDWWRA